MIHFIIYGEPKGKGRPRFYRRGNFVGTYTPEATRIAERSVFEQSLDKKPKTPMTGAILIEIEFYMPIPKSTSKKLKARMESNAVPHIKKPDIDNLIKSILDPLNTIYWEDDSQIYSIKAGKYYGKCPMTKVWIEEIKEGSDV